MSPIEEGSLLWQPSAAEANRTNLARFMRWLAEHRDLHFDTYQALWQWSVDDIEVFWDCLWDFAEVQGQRAEGAPVLRSHDMPGAGWFPGTTINYAENIFAHRDDSRPMILFKAEDRPLIALSWTDIHDQTRRMAAALRALGVGKGDRVAACMPNTPQALIALLACASIGAIWSSCSPDFGPRSILDRFSQIEPRVLIAVDGYRYGGKWYDRRELVRELQTALPSLQATIVQRVSEENPPMKGVQDWDTLLAAVGDDPLVYTPLPFDHPLWILYSSGTTGLPKPIVHGHGGIVLEHIKATMLHNDIHPGEVFFWYSSTGWMMWNYLIGSLFAGSTILMLDGSPAYPDMDALWALAEKAGVTYFGTSAAFISACMKADIHPNQQHDLSRIRAVGSTGSPLTVPGFAWIYANINQHLALESLSGGTDLCTAFVGGARLKPIYAGEIQGASLGAKVQAFNDSGEPVVDEVGELVITEPMPSMPLYFWNDPDYERYTASYFEMFPGVWRHGDWIRFNRRGGCVIYGRSDSTINRQGIRMGTSEIYQAVESQPEILDSLVIDLEYLGRESRMILFVVLRDGYQLTDELQARTRQKLREDVSPRHLPNEIRVIDAVPYTLSGKKMEVPVRRILLGQDPEKAANRGAMRNPAALDPFIELAGTLSKS